MKYLFITVLFIGTPGNIKSQRQGSKDENRLHVTIKESVVVFTRHRKTCKTDKILTNKTRSSTDKDKGSSYKTVSK